jgi:hypothetical protein
MSSDDKRQVSWAEVAETAIILAFVAFLVWWFTK